MVMINSGCSRNPVSPSRLGLLLVLAGVAVLSAAAAPATAVGATGFSSVTGVLSPEIAAELAANGKVIRTSAAGEEPRILPKHLGAESIGARLSVEKPTVLVEAVYAYKRPRPVDASAELRAIYGNLLSISSLQGIEYWSTTRKKMRTFYTESWRIDGPERRTRLPDDVPPASGSLPLTASYFSYQRDSTFGPNVYRISYSTYPDAVLLETANVTTISYLGLPLMKPNALKVRALVIQTEDALLFYVASAGTVADFPMLRDKIEESIANRAEALFKWFTAHEDEARGRS